MSIHYGSKQSLVNYLNSANGSSLTVAELNFGTPQETEGTWREGLVAGNTAIKITAKPESLFQGARVVTYDRLNLNDFPKLCPLSVKVYGPTKLSDFFPALFRRYGLVLSPEDFVDGPFSYAGAGSEVVALVAKPEAIGWTGSLAVTVQSGQAVLSQHLTTVQLPGLNYAVPGDGTTGSALTYMYGLDFTSQKSVLETYQVGTILGAGDTALLDAIKAVDTNAGKSLWNLDPAQLTWSLAGAEVVYSGINSGVLPTNSSYKYVLGLLMRANVTTPPGVFYLHYDDPVDPNEV
jgi:hypothetical protein